MWLVRSKLWPYYNCNNEICWRWLHWIFMFLFIHTSIRGILQSFIYIYIYIHVYIYMYIQMQLRCQLCIAFVSASCVTSTSNGRTVNCRNQGTNCNTKWAVHVIMCDVCGMQYVGQTNNIRLRMNRHKSDYRIFLNGDFSKSDTSSPYSKYNLMMLIFSSAKYWKFLKMKVLDIPKKFDN